MDKIDSMIKEHATLRRLADSIVMSLGAQTGVGWDDCTDCEMTNFFSAQRVFQDMLAEHEASEERVLHAFLRRRKSENAELEPVLHRAHASLNGMTALLRTLSNVCDGEHVYAVRTMAERLREELETHLTYEEKVLFPLLRRNPVVVYRRHGVRESDAVGAAFAEHPCVRRAPSRNGV